MLTSFTPDPVDAQSTTVLVFSAVASQSRDVVEKFPVPDPTVWLVVVGALPVCVVIMSRLARMTVAMPTRRMAAVPRTATALRVCGVAPRSLIQPISGMRSVAVGPETNDVTDTRFSGMPSV